MGFLFTALSSALLLAAGMTGSADQRVAEPADLVFANHVLMGAPVGAASGLPFRVKAHGSELEYSMRGRP